MNDKLAVCKNAWCKAHFKYNEEEPPKVCPKCKSFDNDLSGGVSWKDKEYDGDRNDGLPHEINISVRKFLK